ncbi:MAG: carboxymethylenebutenolidase [Rhodospirillaceae bacterium]|jgi:carboxymethylenebutenolidase|nr:carboxymethylenebutenolidase [Rhodospirillaceae bacterium]MBT5458490.1 carboxymethylenebutenolidase [Rhodospirillaceae bacterium]
MAETKAERYRAPKGSEININLPGGSVAGFRALHHSGSGPGILLLTDEEGLNAGMKSRAGLFGEEGYSVLALAGDLSVSDIAAAAEILDGFPETEGGIAAVGHGAGGVLACRAAEPAGFQAVIVFDALELAADPAILDAVPCPFVAQFGTKGAADAQAAVEALQNSLTRKDGSRVFGWEEGGPGFSIPGRDGFHKRADSLAHTRTLELIRRVLGPYYDYEALFAEHTYHEFTTRDVDATMATMIEEPYVNHTPTLTGGVGHDMLKRFYKYHFVDQNGAGRSRERISFTLGPDRLVVESYTKFSHDSVIDRYFPNIEPTGKQVEIATVIIVKFRGDKVCHEHLYWDQGSALKQIGVLDAGNLPIAGPEAARKVLDENDPSNIFMQEAWATSDGKPI